MIRWLIYKAARATYKRRCVPFKCWLRGLHCRMELRALSGRCGRMRVKTWQRAVFRLGMWLVRCGDGMTGDWLVHHVPFEVRFSLA